MGHGAILSIYKVELAPPILHRMRVEKGWFYPRKFRMLTLEWKMDARQAKKSDIHATLK